MNIIYKSCMILLLQNIILANSIEFTKNTDNWVRQSLVLGENGLKLISLEDQDIHYGSQDELVSVNYLNTINENGWAQLEITTNLEYNNSMQSYGAGYAEGAAMKSLISLHWKNGYSDFCQPLTASCKKIKEFLQKNLEYMIEMLNGNENDPYWNQVNYILLQAQGIADGLHGREMNLTLRFEPFNEYLLNLMGDMETLQQVYQGKSVLENGRCSALIKLLPGYSDLFVAHDTWSGYQDMLRVVKKYTLNLKDDNGMVMPGHTASFTSEPGHIFSGDDYYILSSGLTTMETTIGNSNPELWKYLKHDSILEWIRNLVANRLAKTGSEWAKIFSRHNSGTYNNQWMIVDYNQFKPGVKSETGLLQVLEQLPGMTVFEDKTDVLVENGYWASYNSPYFPSIFNASGLPAMVEEYGDLFTHDKTPRALIFARNHSMISNVGDVIKLMRYNDFKHDPLSVCDCSPPYSSELTIAARCDLNPISGTYPLPMLGFRNHGAIDVKVTSYDLQSKFEMIAECGPTHDQQPVFVWSKSPFANLSHYGMPDRYDFEPIHIQW